MNGPMAGEWMCLLATATFWITGSRVLSGQPGGDVPHGVQPRQRVERAAVMPRRQIRRAHHGQGGGEQHVLDRGAGGEPVVGAGDDVLGRRLLDEAHERLDGLGIRDGSGHAASSRYGALLLTASPNTTPVCYASRS